MESHRDWGKCPLCRRPASQRFPPVIQKARVFLSGCSRQRFQGQTALCSSIALHCSITLAECDSAGEGKQASHCPFNEPNAIRSMNVYHFHCPDTPPPNYTSSSDRIGFGSCFFFSTSSLVRILSLRLKLEGGNYILARLSFGRTDNPLLFIRMAASICAPRYRFPPMSLSPRQDGQLFCTERRTEQSPAY